jgi:8-oxo-dGTP pyrophosphatase MutT (NUDIX family)
MEHLRSAGAVVFRGRGPALRFLLIRNAKGHWDFPKGRIEPGETPRQAAVRETAEETGLRRLRFVPGFLRICRWRYREGGRSYLKTTRYWLASAPGGRVRLSPEHTRAVWVPPGKAPDLLKFANQRRLLKGALNRLSRVPGRNR